MLVDDLQDIRVKVFEGKDIKIVTGWYKRLIDDYKSWELCMKLKNYPNWQLVPDGILLDLANAVDTPFVRLMLWLSQQRATYTVSQHLRAWRRMKALRQDNILSYVRQKNLLEYIYRKEEITPDIIIGLCFQTAESLERFNEGWSSDKSVEYAIREILGCSMAADIRVEWKHWVVKNHPDKGGDHDMYVRAVAAYDEWRETCLQAR